MRNVALIALVMVSGVAAQAATWEFHGDGDRAWVAVASAKLTRSEGATYGASIVCERDETGASRGGERMPLVLPIRLSMQLRLDTDAGTRWIGIFPDEIQRYASGWYALGDRRSIGYIQLPNISDANEISNRRGTGIAELLMVRVDGFQSAWNSFHAHCSGL